MLTAKQLEDIKQLQQACEEFDSIQLKLNWDMLETRLEHEKTDFLEYQDGQLIGFIGIYGFGNKAELCGMVLPHYRRKGVFTSLFQSAIKECEERKVRRILLNAPAASTSARGFFSQLPCRFSFAEYQMKWMPAKVTLPMLDDLVVLRPSTPADQKDEMGLDVECFGFTSEEAADFYERLRMEDNQSFLMIVANEQTIGKIRVQRMQQDSWIFGFSIYPQHQGKGYGKTALMKIVQQERDFGQDVFLEVAAENEHALRLYTTSGFVQFNTQDYYEYHGV